MSDPDADRPTEPISAVQAAEPGETRPVARVVDLRKRFRRTDGTVVPAVDSVSLEIHAGEFVVLLGPSGCGKTTLLRCIGGLDEPDSGTIELHQRTCYSSQADVNIAPERRRVSMIFQSYALWPHMSAFDNVAYPLRSRRVPKHEVRARVTRVLEIVGIAELARQYPGQMSGGQQQRIALARAVVGSDDLILFDEPLSNVDAKVREQLRAELLAMQRELGFAALYVTHDQIEAMELAHRIAVMNHGRIEQVGSPREIYERPRSRYVANFIGTANELAGTVKWLNGVECGIETELGDTVATASSNELAVGDAVYIVWRPEKGQISRAEPRVQNRWRATVQMSIFVGSHCEHILTVGGRRFRLWDAESAMFDQGDPVWISIEPRFVRVVPGSATLMEKPRRSLDSGP